MLGMICTSFIRADDLAVVEQQAIAKALDPDDTRAYIPLSATIYLARRFAVVPVMAHKRGNRRCIYIWSDFLPRWLRRHFRALDRVITIPSIRRVREG